MQIVYSSRHRLRSIQHLGSAHEEGELAVLRAVTRQRLAAGRVRKTLVLALQPAPAIS